jgi:uncharacterized membrane protein YccC
VADIAQLVPPSGADSNQLLCWLVGLLLAGLVALYVEQRVAQSRERKTSRRREDECREQVGKLETIVGDKSGQYRRMQETLIADQQKTAAETNRVIERNSEAMHTINDTVREWTDALRGSNSRKPDPRYRSGEHATDGRR